MTQPADAAQSGNDRFYKFNDQQHWSVTTILNVLNKPALPGWAAGQSADYAIDHWDELGRLKDHDKGQARKLISTAHRRTVEKSQWVGNNVHEMVQRLTEGGALANLELKSEHIQHFLKWEAAYKPEYLLSEATVYNHAYQYAGTFDLLAKIDGKNVLIDVKTGNNVYPEVALQLCAYAHGEFIGKGGEEIALPPIDSAAVLHLRPNKWTFIPVRIDDDVWMAFLHCRYLFDWTHDISKTVLT